MVVRAMEMWRELTGRRAVADFETVPFRASSGIASPGRGRTMWVGVAGAAAILPALALGIGYGSKSPASVSDNDPTTTQALAAPAAVAASAAPATVATVPAQPVQVDRVGALAMIRNVIIAVQQANETGNYTVLRDLGAPAFQSANTAARLSDIFSGLRARNLDLSAAAAIEPQMTAAPEIGLDGMMRMAGLIAAAPAPIAFDFAFTPVEGRWLPFSISIALAPPSAPTPAPTAEKRPEPQPTRSSQTTVPKQRAMAQPLDSTRTQ